jgi:hypothetical protein
LSADADIEHGASTIMKQASIVHAAELTESLASGDRICEATPHRLDGHARGGIWLVCVDLRVIGLSNL